MCGNCCKALICNISPQEARRYVLHNYPFYNWDEWSTYSNDIIFIDQELTNISYEQAVKINPQIKEWNLTEEERKTRWFYKCPHLTEENECSIHDKLEPNHMCDGYPWYGKIPSDSSWYHKDCGYKQDLNEN